MSAKITPLTKIPFISGEAIKAKNYLDIQRELLTLATQGGPFSPEILAFLKEQGKDTPPVKEFPGIKVTTDGITKLHDGSLQMIDGAKKLEDGSRQLRAGAAQIKKEGTDTIKERMVAGADPIMRKLASIETAKQLVLKYDRFAGKPSPVKSSVEIIMKTPDEAADTK
jgi:X-X-X-Leu-X-X-Gly heptad repeat protein